MANRFIKETILTSPSINSLDPKAERLFYRLLLISDNYGCFEGPANVIISRCFPLKATDPVLIEEVSSALDKLGKAGIVGYWAKKERIYGVFLKWGEHNPKYAATDEGKQTTIRRKTPIPPKDLHDSLSSLVSLSQVSSKQEVKKDKQEVKNEKEKPSAVGSAVSEEPLTEPPSNHDPKPAGLKGERKDDTPPREENRTDYENYTPEKGPQPPNPEIQKWLKEHHPDFQDRVNRSKEYQVISTAYQEREQ